MSTDKASDLNYLKELLKNSLRLIESYRARENNLPKKDKIAIVSMACRFPGGANTPERYWELLNKAEKGSTHYPVNRAKETDINLPYPAHYLAEDLSLFDPLFFGISPREAKELDPQQRIILELVAEALASGGYDPKKLTAPVGVFVGAINSEFNHHLAKNNYEGSYVATGTLDSIISGRISFTYNFSGPSITIDAACSSALAAVHNACESLLSHECAYAFAGGVNIILDPNTFVMLNKMNALAGDGQCKTFSAEADGYGRGEGSGIVLLRRLSDALAAGEEILAVIDASVMNHDGKSAGLTAPNGLAQQKLYQAALEKANLNADDISYVEMHGTGTPLGDPIEVDSLSRVYGKQRKNNPLYLGSAKANIGHLEAAAGMAGLIKSILMLQHNKLVRQPINYPINPRIKLPQNVFIVEESKDYDFHHKKIAISSFGFSGLNVHLILGASPQQQNSKCSFPQILFNKSPYWPKFKNISIPSEVNILFPQVILLPIPEKMYDASTALSSYPLLEDAHNIIHVGLYSSLVANLESTEVSHYHFENIFFKKPLVINSQDFTKVVIKLSEKNWQVFSEEDNQKWLVHAEGNFSTSNLKSDHSKLCKIDNCKNVLTKDSFYKLLASLDIKLGDSVCCVQEVKIINAKHCVATLKSVDMPGVKNPFPFSVNILDGCAQLFHSLSKENGFQKKYMVSEFKNLIIYKKSFSEVVYCELHLNPISTSQQLNGRFNIYDTKGELLASCQSCIMKSVNLDFKRISKLETAGVSLSDLNSSLETLVHISRELLDINHDVPIDIHRPLTDYGLDSLTAAALIQNIEKSALVSLPQDELLSGISIAEINKRINKNNSRGKFQENMPSNPWLKKSISKDAENILYCFPYGGSGASIFKDWQNIVGPSTQICPIYLPGREERYEEVPYHDIDKLTQDLLPVILEHADKPFSFYGHSFGALIAFDLAHKLKNNSLLKALSVGAFSAPIQANPWQSSVSQSLSFLNTDLYGLLEKLDSLDENNFRQVLKIFKIPKDKLVSLSLQSQKQLAKILITDVCLVSSYHYQPYMLNIPIYAFHGAQDDRILKNEMMDWKNLTTSEFNYSEVLGDHFFINNKNFAEEILKKIKNIFKTEII